MKDDRTWNGRRGREYKRVGASSSLSTSFLPAPACELRCVWPQASHAEPHPPVPLLTVLPPPPAGHGWPPLPQAPAGAPPHQPVAPHDRSSRDIPCIYTRTESNTGFKPRELQDARKTQQSKWCPCKEHYTNIRIRSRCSLIASNHFNPINPSRLCPGCFSPSPKECDGIGDPRSSLL